MPYKVTRSKPTGVPGVRQDGPKRFLVCVQWIDQRTGRRRKREAVASSLAEAVSLRETLKGVDPVPKPTRQRFGDYAAQWLKVHSPRFAQSTTERYTVALAHATVGLGQIYVDALMPSDIRRWVIPFLKDYSAVTINGWLRLLRQVLDEAVGDGLLDRNPAQAVKAFPEGRTKGRRAQVLSLDEFRLFLAKVHELSGDKISEDVARMLLTVAWTGMRKGEVVALRWSDYVDGELHVERSVWKRTEKTTKTDDPRRIVVVEPLRQVLTAQRQWLIRTQHPGLESGLIFPASLRQARAGATRRNVDELSWYRAQNILAKPLAKVVKEAGITEISPHSLRRTWENLLRAAGVDQLVRRALAGWRTEKAQAIYATVDKEERQSAGSAVVDLVMEGKR